MMFKTFKTSLPHASLLCRWPPQLVVTANAQNDTWNKVMSRGKLVVGVKADYKPWGYRDLW